MKSNIIYILESTDEFIIPSSIRIVGEYIAVGHKFEEKTDNGILKCISLGIIEYTDLSDLKKKCNKFITDLGY